MQSKGAGVLSVRVLDLEGFAALGEVGGRDPRIYLYWSQQSTWAAASTPSGLARARVLTSTYIASKFSTRETLIF